ncbi:FG-GAP repeat protein [Cyanobium sp. Maggiore-St4-Cus]|uniref:DUF4114 domain-containing protein n=1 Tax=Cyanobium sp. Maggiore-St4-Cus TaxID=2823717 RepID=UPI0020CCE437|nr:DUF4114 domain-containing protein [Cyanobium sp. Maggiore-St4-Cus]MCP9789043.1 FG-GAP repeat protein [Cyanobium sp. Maggiore-St4-Cus]
MPTTSSFQSVIDANGTSHGFLVDNGLLLQCQWNPEAGRWEQGEAVPGAVGGDSLSVLYLDKLWPTSSTSSSGTWNPGLVVAYRTGRGNGSEIQAVFGQWNSNGELQWSAPQALTSNGVNEKEFSLVAGVNGGFSLVSQKQEERPGAEGTATGLGIARPDTELYREDFALQRDADSPSGYGLQVAAGSSLQGLVLNPASAPLAAPRVTTGEGIQFNRSTLVFSGSNALPGALPGSGVGGAVWSGTRLSGQASTGGNGFLNFGVLGRPVKWQISVPLYTTGRDEVSDIYSRSSSSSGSGNDIAEYGSSQPILFKPIRTFEDLYEAEKVFSGVLDDERPRSRSVKFLSQGLRDSGLLTLTGLPSIGGDISRATGGSGDWRWGIYGRGSFGLLNTGEGPAFDSFTKLAFVVATTDQVRSFSDAVNFILRRDNLTKKVTKNYAFGFSGSVASEFLYASLSAQPKAPIKVVSREALAVDLGASYTQRKFVKTSDFPVVRVFNIKGSDSFGYQWVQTLSNNGLPIAGAGGILPEVAGLAADSATAARFLYSIYGFTQLRGETDGLSRLVKYNTYGLAREDVPLYNRDKPNTLLYTNLALGLVGTATSLLAPVGVAVRQPATQASKQSLFNATTLSATVAWNGLGFEANLFNNISFNAALGPDRNNAFFNDRFLAEVGFSLLGAFQPILRYSTSYTASGDPTVVPAPPSASGPGPQESAGLPGEDVGDAQPVAGTDPSPFYYNPSLGSTASDGAGASTLSSTVSTLYSLVVSAGPTDLVGTRLFQLSGSSGRGLNDGSYTNVRLLGVVPEGSDSYAEASIVVTGGAITSVVITKTGTYLYLPPYSTIGNTGSAGEVVLVPEFYTVNPATGTNLADPAAVAQGIVVLPTILVTTNPPAGDPPAQLSKTPISVFNQVKVGSGGSGYPLWDASTATATAPVPGDNTPYTYSGVSCTITAADGSGPIANLQGATTTNATVVLVAGKIQKVILEQPFYTAAAASAAGYSLDLQLPADVVPTAAASLSLTPSSASYNNFIDDGSFSAQAFAPGSEPTGAGVYIAAGNTDSAPLFANQKALPLQSRVVYRDSKGNSTYLNAISWMAATPTRPAYWGVTNNRAVLPVDGYQSTLPEFSLASQPVSTQVSSTGEPLVAWVENLTSQGIVQRAVPSAGANGLESYQKFIGDVYSNQRIAYSYKNARGEWETNPLYYIPADGAIIQNLQVVNTTPVGAGSPQVLMVWTETSIEAMQGLKPQLSSLQNGSIPTVIKSAQFDPQNARFSTPQVVPWDPSTEVGLGVTDLNLSSQWSVAADGSLVQTPSLSWSQYVATPYQLSVLNSSPVVYDPLNLEGPGLSNNNLGSLANSPQTFTSASSTGLQFGVAGALQINSDAAVQNSDGTGVLSIGVGSLNGYEQALAAQSGVASTTPSQALPRSPYSLEFWVKAPAGKNPEGAGMLALGQPSEAAVGAAVLPAGWSLTSSFVVEQLTWAQAVAKGLIASSAIPSGQENDLYGYNWGLVADGANSTASGASNPGGSNLYSNALSITNLVAGTALPGMAQFLASYGLSSDVLKGSSGVSASVLATVPGTALQFNNALVDGSPSSSLNGIAVDTSSALINSGVVTAASSTWTDNANLQTLFAQLWSYQQSYGKPKVNFSLDPASSIAPSASTPSATAQEQYAAYGLNFQLNQSTAVSIDANGKLVFDVGAASSLLSDAAINDGNWHYVVATYLPDYVLATIADKQYQVPQLTGTASLYIDGKAAATPLAIDDVFSPTTEADSALLLYGNAGGSIDEVALYTTALTAVEAKPAVFDPQNPWPMMSGKDALELVQALGYNIAQLNQNPGVEIGAINQHWQARSVDPNGAEKATFTATYATDASGDAAWTQAQSLNLQAAPIATLPSATRPTLADNLAIVTLSGGDWSSFNPAQRTLASVTAQYGTVVNGAFTPVGSAFNLAPDQILLGNSTLQQLQPAGSDTNLSYTFLTNTPELNLLVPLSEELALQQRQAGNTYSVQYKLNFTPNLTSTTPPPTVLSGTVTPSQLLPVRQQLNPSALQGKSLYPSAIATADVLEQATSQLQYIDSGEVIQRQSVPSASTPGALPTPVQGFGYSTMAGRYNSDTSTPSGWLAIAQPFTPTAGSNPAGRIWIQYTGQYPSSGNPSTAESPITWLNALARSSFSDAAPNLPLLNDARNPSSGGGLLIQADPTAGWGGNIGNTMLVVDLNGDGNDELIIAAPNTNAGGTVYIIDGSWIQTNLATNPEILDLSNPENLGDVVTVLTPAAAGGLPAGDDSSNALFGTALAFDGTDLIIGAPGYQRQMVSGDNSTAVSIGAVYRFNTKVQSLGSLSPRLSQQLGQGGSLQSRDPLGETVLSYWGEQLGSAITAAPNTGEVAIAASGYTAALQYSGKQAVQNELDANSSPGPFGDGALLRLQLASALNTTAGSGSFADVANASQGNSAEASGYMQRLKALMTDPIVKATAYADQSLTANAVGAVYYYAAGAAADSAPTATFYGPSPWNTGATGFGSSLTLADLNNTQSKTLVIGAASSGGPGATYFIAPEKLPSTALVDASSGSPQYLAYLSAGLTLYGNATTDQFGYGLASGDVNNDGYDDVLIQAPNAGSSQGAGYLVFGTDSIDYANAFLAGNGPYTGTIGAGGIGSVRNNAGSLALDVLVESNAVANAETGRGSFNIKDVDGNGIPDILLGARGAGSAYITYGKEYLADISSFQLNKLAGNNGFILEGLASTTQGSLRSIGDINGDGYGDFFSRQDGGLTSTIRIELGASTDDILAQAAQSFISFSVSSDTQVLAAGDVNGDGLSDLALFRQVDVPGDNSPGAGSLTGLLFGDVNSSLQLGENAGLLVDPYSAPLAQQITDGLTDQAPAMTVVGDTLYSVVKGLGNTNLYINTSRDGGNTWQSWFDITTESQAGVATNLGASIAYFDGLLQLAYVDATTGTISVTSLNPDGKPDGWSAPQRLAGFSTSAPPLLLDEGSRLALYWLGEAGTIQQSFFTPVGSSGGSWTSPQAISTPTGEPITSLTALAGVVTDTRTILAYGGRSTDAASLGQPTVELIASTPSDLAFTSLESLLSADRVAEQAPGLTRTSTGLALTYTTNAGSVQLGTLDLAAASSSGDEPAWSFVSVAGLNTQLATTPLFHQGALLINSSLAASDAVELTAIGTSSGVTWLNTTAELGAGQGQSLSQRAGAANPVNQPVWSDAIGGASPSAPSMATSGATISLAVHGTDDQIYWNQSTDAGSTWKGWVALPPGMTTYKSPSIAVFNGELYLCYLGKDNNQINITRYVNGSWVNQYQIPGQSATAAMLLTEGDKLAVYFTANDSRDLILKAYSASPSSSSGWSTTGINYADGTQTLPQTASSAIAATRFNGQTYLAYLGGTRSNRSSTVYITTTPDSQVDSSAAWEIPSTLNEGTTPPVLANGLGLALTSNGTNLVLSYADTANGNKTQLLRSGDGANWVADFGSLAAFDSSAAIALGYSQAAGASAPALVAAAITSSEAIQFFGALNSNSLSASETASSLQAVGDVNGDGYDDLMVTSANVGYDPTGRGQFTGPDARLLSTARLLLGAATPAGLAAQVQVGASQALIQAFEAPALGTEAPLLRPTGAPNPSAMPLQVATSLAFAQRTPAGNLLSPSRPVTAAEMLAKAGDPASLLKVSNLLLPSGVMLPEPAAASTGQGGLNSAAGYGDLNGDGYTDYLAADGLLNPYAPAGSGYGVWSIRAAGDVNGNGCDDVFLALSPVETAGQFIQSVLVDGALFHVVDNQFSLNQAGLSSSSSGAIWTTPGLKAALDPYTYAYSDPTSGDSIPSLQTWFEGIQSYQGASSLTAAPSLATGAISPAGGVIALAEDGSGLIFAPSPTGSYSFGTVANSNWQVRSQALSLPGISLTNLAWFEGKLYAAFTSTIGSGKSAEENVIGFAYCSDPTAADPAWTVISTLNGEQALTAPVLVNEGSYLALYFVGTDSKIHYLFSNDPSSQTQSSSGSSGSSWGSSLQAGSTPSGDTFVNTSGVLRYSGGVQTSSGRLTAARFQGRTVLAYFSGTDSKPEGGIGITVQPTATPWLNNNWGNVQFVSANATSGGGLSLAATSTQLYLAANDGASSRLYTASATRSSSSSAPALNWSSGKSFTGVLGIPQLTTVGGRLVSTVYSDVNGYAVSPLDPSLAAAAQQSLAGYSIDANLDINGDGFQDLLISDPSNPSLGLDNQYAIFGGDYFDIGTLIGTPADDTQIGTPLGDVIYALEGSDVIISNGGRDIILAGSGNDAISIINARFRRIDGGIGVDSLQLEGQANQDWNFSLNTAAINPAAFSIRPGNRLRSIEAISSQGFGANTLQFDAAAINAINSNHTVFLTPDATDSILLSDDLQRDPSRDTVYSGLRWNAYSGSTNAALLYVAVPSSQTALTASGENVWLASHVGAVGPQAPAAALLAEASVSGEPADPLLPRAIASEVDLGKGLRLLSFNALDPSDAVRFVLERSDASGRRVVMYTTTSVNSNAEAGIHYTPVVGLVIFEPGDSRQEITVPIKLEAFQRLRGGRLSLQVYDMPDVGQKNACHLLIQPAAQDDGAPPVLSGFELTPSARGDGASLRFRADANGSSSTLDSLRLTISQRLTADAREPVSSQTVSVLDAIASSGSQVPAYDAVTGALALDNDDSHNGQISGHLELNFSAANGQPTVSLAAPALQWQTPLQLSADFTFRLLPDVPLTLWRSDTGSEAVSFGLESGGRSFTLLSNASAGSEGSLDATKALDDSAFGWQSTEGKAVGSRAVIQGLSLAGTSWRPTATQEGQALKLLDLRVAGNQITAKFAGGVSAVYAPQATGSAPSPAPILPSVQIQRLGRYENAFGLYAVDSVTGLVDGLAPGHERYLQAALARSESSGLLLSSDRLPDFGKQVSFEDLPLDLNRAYGMLLLVDGDRQRIFSSFAGANPDGAAQMISLGSASNGLVVGFEDQSIALGSGPTDHDFNDVIVTIRNVTVPLF